MIRVPVPKVLQKIAELDAARQGAASRERDEILGLLKVKSRELREAGKHSEANVVDDLSTVILLRHK